ncbi:MAG: hypothetical protein ACK5L3_13730 [Oscillospiraceae bacterium]
MKVKQHGARIEEPKQLGKTNREIGAEVGLTKEQIKGYFERSRREQRERGYPRSKKADAQKTNQALRSELKSLRMENQLLKDFLQLAEMRRGQL